MDSRPSQSRRAGISQTVKAAYVPCWISRVGQTPEDLQASLERWAIESISDAVQEIRKDMKILSPEKKAVA